MKNQIALIVTIVTVVLALIAIVAFLFTKPEAKQPAAPEKVVTAAPQLPAGDVQFATSLPGASNSPGGGATAAAGGRGPAAGGDSGGMSVSTSLSNPTGR